MLGKLPWKSKSYSGLNLPGRNGRLLVVPSELRRLARQFLKNIIYKGIHDSHGLAGYTDIWMNLLENLEDIDLVGLNILFMPFLSLLVSAFFGELLLGLGSRLLLCGRRFRPL